MKSKSYAAKVRKLALEFRDYRADAYYFIADSVSHTVEQAKRSGGETRHVSGEELLDGFRELALQRFGALALDVLADWGIHRSEDVGVLVFRMVEHGLLGATPDDRLEDFADGFDFRTAFLGPFEVAQN
jgi:uncharacterized repeat protein (TIGR04138 family)